MMAKTAVHLEALVSRTGASLAASVTILCFDNNSTFATHRLTTCEVLLSESCDISGSRRRQQFQPVGFRLENRTIVHAK